MTEPQEVKSKSLKLRIFPRRNLHFKVHLVIGTLLLILAFAGVILTDWHSQYTQTYWNIMVVVFALSSLTLSWLSARKDESFRMILLWREMLHWAGLFASVYLVAKCKSMGFFSLPVASLVVLLLLALTTFLAGVHFDFMFIFIGIFLGLIALFSVIFFEYLSLIVLPVMIALAILMYWYQHRSR